MSALPPSRTREEFAAVRRDEALLGPGVSGILRRHARGARGGVVRLLKVVAK
jgi:hypothetical protein